MKVLNILQQHNYQLPYQIGKEIGTGADGECFELPHHPDKVIKLSILYQTNNSNLQQLYLPISETLHYLIVARPSVYARVFEYQMINIWDQGYLIYYYLMERLIPLTADEEKVFHTITSHEDRRIEKDLSEKIVNNKLMWLSKGLEFNIHKVKLLCRELQYTNIQHNDLAPRNIMKDKYNNYKIIDFDRCQLKTLTK
jgi:hypothetical protein